MEVQVHGSITLPSTPALWYLFILEVLSVHASSKSSQQACKMMQVKSHLLQYGRCYLRNHFFSCLVSLLVSCVSMHVTCSHVIDVLADSVTQRYSLRYSSDGWERTHLGLGLSLSVYGWPWSLPLMTKRMQCKDRCCCLPWRRRRYRDSRKA